MLRKLPATLLLLSVACAVGGHDAPARRAAATGSDCPNEAGVAKDANARRPGSLSGDVDGDGSRDRVFIAEDPSGREGCRMFLVVLTRSLRLSAPVHQPGFEPVLRLPFLRSLAALDARPGREVVVDMLAGASTTFAAAYTVERGTLARLTIEGDDPAADDLFPYGGSAGHAEGVQCVGEHVVIGRATTDGQGWRIERRFFARAPGALVLVPRLTRVGSVAHAELTLRPEFAGPPFSRCGG